jgi:NADH-quinone oxidoreductase subunit M
MLTEWPILSMIAFSPLIGILVILFLKKEAGQWIKWTAVVTTLIPLVLSAWLYFDFDKDAGTMQYAEEVNWIRIDLNRETGNLPMFKDFYYEFNYEMAVDGLSVTLVFLTALISVMAALASTHIKKRWKTYFLLFLLLEIGMFGVFMAKDLFLFFLFFELVLIPSYFLIGIWGYRNREKAANQFIIYNGVGSAIMLLAFLILINTAGFSVTPLENNQAIMTYSGDIETIAANLTDAESYANMKPEDVGVNLPFYTSPELLWTTFIMLIVAFGIKLPLFPFHTWMLRVHTEAPTGMVMIHSGILLKMGAYGLIRFGVQLFPDHVREAATALAILGVVNILYGAVLAFRQKEFKLILAYSSVSHMGIILLGIASLNEIGMQGAVFQMVSHGLIAALMFLIVGSLYERTGTSRIDELGGLAKAAPFMCGMLLAAGLASLGLPGLSGFIAEYMSFLGLFDTKPVLTIIAAVSVVLTAAYVLRGVLGMTFGPFRGDVGDIREARLIEALPMIALFAFIVLLGVYPSVLGKTLLFTVQNLVQTLVGG